VLENNWWTASAERQGSSGSSRMHITNPIFRDHSKTLKKFKIAQIPKKKVVIGHKQASSIYETYYFLNRNIVNVDNQDFGELKNKFKKIKI